MSRKPFFTDEQVQYIVESSRRLDTTTSHLAMDLQRARAEARGRKEDQARLKQRITQREETLSCTTEKWSKALSLVDCLGRALRKITDPDLPSLATAAQIAKEALKDG